jgi:hypothetical protein
VGDIWKRFTGTEPLDHLVHGSASANEQRAPEGTTRVSNNHWSRRDRQYQLCSPSTRIVRDEAEVLVDDLGEDPLTCNDHSQHAVVSMRVGVVIQYGGAVCVETTRRKRMIDTHLMLDDVQRAPYVLHRHASPAQCRRHHAFHESNERYCGFTSAIRLCRDNRHGIDVAVPVTTCPRCKRRSRHTQEASSFGDGVERDVEAGISSCDLLAQGNFLLAMRLAGSALSYRPARHRAPQLPLRAPEDGEAHGQYADQDEYGRRR